MPDQTHAAETGAPKQHETDPDLFLAAEKPGDAYAQSFAKGLMVIRSFNEKRPAQTLTQVAQVTGLTRSGARRILLTLVKLGYAACEGRLFSLSPKILDLGFSYLSAMPFWKLAQPILENLVAATGESCSISVLDGPEIVYVLRVPTRQVMSINLSIGSRLPAYCTSMGRVLLSGLPEQELDAVLRKSRLVAHTRYTKTDPGELKEVIAQCRRQGWTSVYKELEEELGSLAVPIKNRRGKIIAAVNSSARALLVTPEQLRDRFLDPLRAAAERISAMMV